MKTLMIAAVTLFGFGIVGMIAVGGVLATAYYDATTTQRPVIDAIANQDTRQFLEHCTPELQASIDEPVLALWMASAHEVLGDRQPTSDSEFRFDTVWQSGDEITTTHAKVHFEFGHADVSMVYVNGKMDSIDFKPSRLVPVSKKRPQDIKIFEQRGQQLLTAFASSDPSDALPVMHSSLRELLPTESLNELCENYTEVIGDVIRVEPMQDATFDPQSGELKIAYQVEGTQGSVVTKMNFVFHGFRGQVIGFDLNLDEVQLIVPSGL